ncbi:hypothetical protein IGI86_003300 [Enterococcus sp. AZ188]|uniref:hypothetical protein n=1 Tax=unclassified Enterococcus TaxID=2608891 RepID=UPI0009845F20|nr:hypothetical protein [uncultured Enterococcus sp.]OOG24716.1 hypothetical protein BZK37_14315 [Enterococcus casseliflavus]
MGKWLSNFSSKLTKNWVLQQLIECIVLIPIFFLGFIIINIGEENSIMNSFLLSLLASIFAFVATLIYTFFKKKRIKI